MISILSEGPVTTPTCIVRRFAKRLQDLRTEQLWMVTMRIDHSVIREHLICEGEPDRVRFKPREVLRPAIIDEADVIAFVHNHPSGNPAPSPRDIASTAQMKEACEVVGIRLLDSLIVAGEQWYSFENNYEERP